MTSVLMSMLQLPHEVHSGTIGNLSLTIMGVWYNGDSPHGSWAPTTGLKHDAFVTL